VLALQGYRKRLRRLRAQRSAYSPALLHELIARAYVLLRTDPTEAAQCARLGEQVAKTLAEEEGRHDSLRALAHAFILGGRFPSGLKALEAAGVVMREHSDNTRLNELDLLRLQPNRELAYYDELSAIGRRVLALFDHRGDGDGVLHTHMALAHLAFRAGRPRDALRHYDTVERLAHDKTSDRFWGTLAVNRASALVAARRFRAAARHFDLARKLLTAAGCDHLVAQMDYNRACSDALRGRFERALRSFTAVEPVFRRLQDVRYLALLGLNSAEIHLARNRPEEALRLAVRAGKRFAALHMEEERAYATLVAGRAAERRGDQEEAAIRLRRAGKMFQRLGFVERQASCLLEAAAHALRRERLNEATGLTRRAEALLEGRDLHALAASCHLLQGYLDIASGDTSRALQRANQVRVRFRGLHAPWIQSEAQRLEGRAYEARNQLGEAILSYKYAIEELERYCGDVPPEAAASLSPVPPARLYGNIVDLLVQAGYFDDAFAFAERAKSRSLVQLVAGRMQGGLLRDRAIARRLHRIRTRLHTLYDRLAHRGDAKDGSFAESRYRARELEHEQAKVLEEARIEDPESVSLEAVGTVTLPAVRDDLEPGTVLLDYLLTDDALFTFVVTPQSFRVVRHAVDPAELQRLLDRFRFHLLKFEQGDVVAEDLVLQATRANLGELAEHLIEPVAENLDGDRLVISPDGLLHHVPFHALPWDDGWLVDRFEVVYAPSALVYGFLRDKPTNTVGPSCLVGLPDGASRHVEREVATAARSLGTEHVTLGEEASFERLRDIARDARILHLTTEIGPREEEPLLTALRLADNWLRTEQVFHLETAAEVVVISVGDCGPSDSILALTRGALYAGARALLMSRWPVVDPVPAEFLDRFYYHWQEHGDAATAAKEAMIEIRAHRPHPYYWASFFLAGRPFAPARAAAAGGHVRRRDRAVSTSQPERGSS
jgi:CHAT domain-containing protein/tetratricopeptide (TPR) repeat protein